MSRHSCLPGPPRTETLEFVLNDENAQRMEGVDLPYLERWCDVAGNFYSERFIRCFSYELPSQQGPDVWVRIEPAGRTLAGRIEAHGLKPNFAYQVKLVGDFDDRRSYERIGYHGRWRLPGEQTNYKDRDYETYPVKSDVEAYLLFDFFVTDARGHAVREFSLDNSLHVLWNASRQRGPATMEHCVPAIVYCDNPDTYARPKEGATVELVWAEREHCRYHLGQDEICLPPGRYTGFLQLTEESLHSKAADGGTWATPLSVPIAFEIVE
jgi:hypothetical protein